MMSFVAVNNPDILGFIAFGKKFLNLSDRTFHFCLSMLDKQLITIQELQGEEATLGLRKHLFEE